MDAALSVLKIVAVKLNDCRKKYKQLGKVLDRLEITVDNVRKLAEDRAKERRLKGTIQQTLVKQLKDLDECLDDILAGLSTGAGRAKAFCGSCVGKGADASLTRLEELDSNLRDTLRLADSEVLVAQASAAEEMAGGAAGRHITHEGARNFWRAQYKNELELSTKQFWNGIIAKQSIINLQFGHAQEALRRCLIGRLDVNLDDTVTVNEFQRFTGTATRPLAGNVNMLSILRHAAYDGSLTGVMIHGHNAKITCIDCHEQFLVTGDASAYVRVWTSTSSLVLQCVATVGVSNENVLAVQFNAYDFLTVMVAVGTRIIELDAFTGERISIINEAHNSPVTSISAEGNYMFSTALYPATMAVVWTKVETDRRPGMPRSNQCYVKAGALGDTKRRVEYLEPLGDDTHVCAMTKFHSVDIYDYKKLVWKHRLELKTKLINYVRGTNGIAAVGYSDRPEEDVFEAPLTDSNPTSTSTTHMSGELFQYPTTFITLGCAASMVGKNTIEMCYRPRGVVRRWSIPGALAISLIRCSQESVFLVGSISHAPVIVRFLIKETLQNEKDAYLEPLLIMSDGRWTAIRSYTDKLFFSSVEARAAVAFASNPKKPSDFCIVATASSNRLAVMNPDLRCIYRQSLRYSKRRMRRPISALANFSTKSGAQGLLIGAVDGKIVKVTFAAPKDESNPAPLATAAEEAEDLQAIELSTEGKPEPTATESHETQAQIDQAMRASPIVRGMVKELAFFRDESLKVVDNDEDSLVMIRHLQENIHDLSFATMDFVQPLATAVAELNSVQGEEGRAKLKELIAALDGNAMSHEEPNQDVLTSTSEFSSTVCNPESWLETPATTRIFDGRRHCGGCRALLEGKEIIYQICVKCAERRELKNKCAVCQFGEIYSAKNPVCRSCYDSLHRERDLAVTSIAVVGDRFMIGAIRRTFERSYDPVGHLLIGELDTLRIRSKMHSYCQGINNVAGTDRLGGLFAAPITQRTVGVYDANNVNITTGQLHALDSATPPHAIMFHGAPGAPENETLLVVGDIQGEVRIHHLHREGKPGVVASKTLNVIDTKLGAITCFATNDTFLAIGSRYGEINVYVDWMHEAAPVHRLRIRPHATANIGAMHFTSTELISCADDKTMMRTPLSVFQKEEPPANPRVLYFDVLSADPFRTAGVSVIMVNQEWEFQLDVKQPWAKVTSIDLLLDKMAKTAKSSGTNAVCRLRWLTAQLPATLHLDNSETLACTLRFPGTQVAERHATLAFTVVSGDNADGRLVSRVPWGTTHTVPFPALPDLLNRVGPTGASLVLKPAMVPEDTVVSVRTSSSPEEILASDVPIGNGGRTYIPLDLEKLKSAAPKALDLKFTGPDGAAAAEKVVGYRMRAHGESTPTAIIPLVYLTCN